MAQDLDLGSDLPRIHVCESQQELEQISGIKLCHGFFDPNKYEIYATPDSIAHEVGHVRDISSGYYRSCREDMNAVDKASALMRNESLAIFFAFSKVGWGGAHLPHEMRLIDWLHFEMKKKSFSRTIDLEIADFKTLQELATWMVDENHSWRKHLEFIFRGYLINEQETLWYNRHSQPTRKPTITNR